MIFEVQSGGKTYEVDAPDQGTAVQSLQGLMASVKLSGGAMGALGGSAQAAAGAAAVGAPSVASDISDSAASRYQAGLLDVPGIPGDVGGMVKGAARWTADKIHGAFGETPEAQAARHQLADQNGSNPLLNLPTSEGIKKAVGFEAYQPKTDAGQTFDKYAGAGIEMVPGVLAGGGAKTALGKGADLLKYAFAPAAASEVAGEATKGTALEPWARLGTSILTAMVGGRVGGKGARPSAAPTVDELKAESQSLYDAAKQQGVMVKPAVLDQAIADITKKASAFGIDPTIHPKSFAALKRLQEFSGVAPVNGVKTVASLEDIDMMRQMLGDAASTMDKADSMRALQMRDQLDNFVNGLKPADVVSSGDPRAAVNMLLKARSLWSRKAKGETIGELFRRAELSAPNFSGSGAENAVRSEFRALAKNQRRMRVFSPDERAAIEKVAKGGPMGNLLRMIGKAAPTGIVSAGIGGTAGFTAAGPLGALAVPAVGLAARKAATVSTLRKARAAEDLVLRGSKSVKPPRRPTPLPQMSVLYGAAAGRASDRSK